MFLNHCRNNPEINSKKKIRKYQSGKLSRTFQIIHESKEISANYKIFLTKW